ncbi:interleukin-9 receptor-like isoform X2 [Rhineura floridana]|nr:interleukin-9 receptor-like isoform X2 [Rhineura floridana]
MDCMWNHNQTMGEGLFYLNFTDLLTLYSNLICNLSASREAQDNFCCSVSSEEGEFTENDEYGVSLHASSPGNSQVYPVFAVYEPRLHIACDPPFDLQSKMSSSKCRMQWKKPEAYEDIFLDDFQWEIAFKAAKAPWEQAQTRILVSKETWVDIEGYEFKSGVDYIARIRCKTPDVNWHYRSHWSHWSATTKWTAPPGSWQQFDSHLLRSVLSPLLCLGALLALLLVLMIFWRSKGNGYANVPTPATYFQPLYRFHNGNFKVTALIWGGATEQPIRPQQGTNNAQAAARGTGLPHAQKSPRPGKGLSAAVASRAGAFGSHRGVLLPKHAAPLATPALPDMHCTHPGLAQFSCCSWRGESSGWLLRLSSSAGLACRRRTPGGRAAGRRPRRSARPFPSSPAWRPPEQRRRRPPAPAAPRRTASTSPAKRCCWLWGRRREPSLGRLPAVAGGVATEEPPVPSPLRGPPLPRPPACPEQDPPRASHPEGGPGPTYTVGTVPRAHDTFRGPRKCFFF